MKALPDTGAMILSSPLFTFVDAPCVIINKHISPVRGRTMADYPLSWEHKFSYWSWSTRYRLTCTTLCSRFSCYFIAAHLKNYFCWIWPFYAFSETQTNITMEKRTLRNFQQCFPVWATKLVKHTVGGERVGVMPLILSFTQTAFFYTWRNNPFHFSFAQSSAGTHHNGPNKRNLLNEERFVSCCRIRKWPFPYSCRVLKQLPKYWWVFSTRAQGFFLIITSQQASMILLHVSSSGNKTDPAR